MGMSVDYNHKFTEKEREYLIGHGFKYRVDENDRLYGEPVEPEVDEAEGLEKNEPPVPMTTDPNQGQPVNPDQFPGLENNDDDEGVDEDIADFVAGLKVDELKDELDKYKDENETAQYESDDKKAELAERLANVLQDKRDAGEEVELGEE